MSDSNRQKDLALEVANFGPIVEGKIDLRPLTVFVGPSNTGKSYLAILIYALHRAFGGGESRGFWRFPPVYRRIEDGPEKEFAKKAFSAFDDLVDQVLGANGKPLAKTELVIPAPIAELLRLRLNDQGVHIADEINRCFGVEKTGKLIRKGTRSSAHIVLQKGSSHDGMPLRHELTIKSSASEFKAAIPDGMSIQFNRRDSNFLFELLNRHREKATEWSDKAIWDVTRVVGSLADLTVPHAFPPLHLPAFYLPADRTGVMHAHSVVVSALIEKASMAGLRPSAHTPMLSGVLADFLEQLIQIDSPPYRRQKIKKDRGRAIEDAILGGSVQVERSELIGYPHFTYRPDGWQDGLSLMNASSMVSELAPVVLYLRHRIRPGNVLIIEEPESHLHPAMQVRFIRELAAIVRSGIRIIVTTHSEWVLEALANTVRRSALSKTDRGSAVALRPGEVGAWLFKPKLRPKGSVVDEIKLDNETGLYPTDYDAVSEALYNENVSIFNRIQEKTSNET